MSESTNTAGPVETQGFVRTQITQAKRQYDRQVNMDLSRQNSQQLFKRNMEAVLKQAFKDAEAELQKQQSGTAGIDESWLQEWLQAYEGLIDELMEYALTKHRSSCAMSNFPEEHNPSREYINEVLGQISRDWSEFVSRTKQLLSA